MIQPAKAASMKMYNATKPVIVIWNSIRDLRLCSGHFRRVLG
jgi:hypothetical protein